MGWQQPDELPTTLSTLMAKAMNDQPIQPGEGVLHHAEGVDLIPANIELAGLEVALVNSMNREKMLKQVLDSAKREYDFILLDCMPSLEMLTIYDFLSQKVDVHGACLAPELIDQFVEVVTPIADYSYRWKLNTGCKKSKEERTDLMAVSEKPILTFTIDFETAKRYREANKMPHQFRRAAWTDLTVEVYL